MFSAWFRHLLDAPGWFTTISTSAGVAQLVERHVPNVNVEGSTPFARLNVSHAESKS